MTEEELSYKKQVKNSLNNHNWIKDARIGQLLVQRIKQKYNKEA